MGGGGGGGGGGGDSTLILAQVCCQNFSNPPYSCIPDFRNVYLFMYDLFTFATHKCLYPPPPPPKLCLWVGILFSRCLSVLPTVRVSVTLSFLNILKNH